MKAQLLGMLAESPIHSGSGQSTSFVDLPVSREAATDHPSIPGSSLKGALLDLARRRWQCRPDASVAADTGASESATDNAPSGATPELLGDKNAAGSASRPRAQRVFGTAGHAGDLVVTDARLLLLPVRSLTSVYAWVTCPYIIERLVRDRARARLPAISNLDMAPLDNIKRGEALFADDGELFLEERQFTHRGRLPAGLLDLVEPLVAHETTRARLSAQIAVLSDHDFAWFARYGLAVSARNQLDPEKKTSENLWYEESLPPDSVLYTLLCARGGDSLDLVSELFEEIPYLQVGGNETVGQGWFAIAQVRPGRADANAAGEPAGGAR